MLKETLLAAPLWGSLLAAASLLSSCAPSAPPESGDSAEEKAAAKAGKTSSGDEEGPGRTTLVGRIPAGSFGPRLALLSSTRLVTWAETSGERPGWYALPVPYEGQVGAAVPITEYQEGVQFFELVALPSDEALLLIVRNSTTGQVVEAVHLAADGTAKSGPHLLLETSGNVYWTKALPVQGGALVIWAEQAGEGANLYSLVFGPQGPVGTAEQIVSDARAWQLKPATKGAFLATLEGPEGAGKVAVRRLDAEGAATAAPVIVDEKLTGGVDLDLSVSSARAVVVFSKQNRFQSQLYRGSVDLEGRLLEKSALLTPPRGNQTLVRLVSSPGSRSETVLWEEPEHNPAGVRHVLVGELGESAQISQPRAQLEVHGNDPMLPLATAAPAGGLFVTLAPRCLPGVDCEPTEPRRLVVQTPTGFSGPLTSGLLALEQLNGRPADMAWDLSCGERGCFVLAADAGSPTAVFVADVGAPEGSEPPLRLLDPDRRPRVTAEEVVAQLPEVSQLAGASLGESQLLSWVSFFDPSTPYERPTKPAPDGRMAPVRAQLTTQVIAPNAQGEPVIAEERVISYRARSLGGVALSEERDAERLLGWAALDGKNPQVFLTVVDRSGKKVRQRMLTRTKGEVTDVKVLSLDKGYAVAWVDARGEQPEVYVARVDDRLRTIGKERKITEGASEPTGLHLAQIGGEVLLTWSDARGSSRAGYGDIFAVGLAEADLTPAGAPRRLAATEAHSHSPRLLPVSLGSSHTALLGWVESSPSLTAAQPSRLSLVELDGQGRFVSPPVYVDFDGDIKSFSLHCEGENCRGLSVVDEGERGRLYALSFKAGSKPYAAPLMQLSERPSQLAAPVLLGDRVLLVDADEGRWLLKRLSVAW